MGATPNMRVRLLTYSLKNKRQNVKTHIFITEKPPLAVPEETSSAPPYNPEFMKENEKKDEKVEKPN